MQGNATEERTLQRPQLDKPTDVNVAAAANQPATASAARHVEKSELSLENLGSQRISAVDERVPPMPASSTDEEQDGEEQPRVVKRELSFDDAMTRTQRREENAATTTAPAEMQRRSLESSGKRPPPQRPPPQRPVAIEETGGSVAEATAAKEARSAALRAKLEAVRSRVEES
jgi:hypothetical protein